MDELVKNGLVFELGGGKDGLMYPASGTAPALVLDASGNGNNGVNSGAVLVADHLGNSDGALLIDASGEYVICGDVNISSLYGENGTASFSFRLKYKAESRDRRIIAKYVTPEFAFRFNSGNSMIIVFYDTTSANYVILIANLSLTEDWHHFVIVYDNTQATASKIKLYVDNALISANASVSGSFVSVKNGAGALYIGNMETVTTTQYYNDAICDVAIHNKVLSESETSTLYNGGTVTDGLVLDLPMNRLNCRTNSGIDTAGNNIVTNNGATPCPDHNGRANRGWSFDGVDDYLNLGNNISFSNGTNDLPFTFAAFVNKTSGTFPIFAKTNPLDSLRPEVAFTFNSSGNLQFTLYGNSIFKQERIITTSTFNTNTWYHFVATYDGRGGYQNAYNGMNIYVNGILQNVNKSVVGDYGGVIVPTSNPLLIGASFISSESYKTFGIGRISVPHVFNRVLKTAKLYNYWRSH